MKEKELAEAKEVESNKRMSKLVSRVVVAIRKGGVIHQTVTNQVVITVAIAFDD